MLGVPPIVEADGPDSMGLPPERRLEQLGIDTSLPSLERRALNDANEIETRGIAIRAFGRSRDLAYADTLISLFGEAQRRGTATIAVRKMEAISAAPHLIDDFENDPGHILKMISNPALAKLADASAFPILLEGACELADLSIFRLNALSATKALVVTGQSDKVGC